MMKKLTQTFCVPFPGEAYLRPEEEEPGVGKVQVCAGLQDQGAEEADRAPRERHQEHEGTDPGGEWQQSKHPG